MKLKVKSSKPYIEATVKSATSKDFILVGIRSYSETEIDPVRKEFFNLTDNRIDRLSKQIEELPLNLELTEDELEERTKDLKEEQEKLLSKVIESRLDFYKKQVMFLKEVKLSFEDDEGNVKDLNIPDSREVKPIESLWGNSSECLAALLDIYLDDRNFKDSLIDAIFKSLFGITLNEVKVKN